MTNKCPLIFFTKHFRTFAVEQLIARAHEIGFEGYDVACRPGYHVAPDDVGKTLPKFAKQMRSAGLEVPMITSDFDLLEPTHPTAEPILGAMGEAGVELLKIGYFIIDNKVDDYWDKVSYVRRQFEGWARLGEKHGVRICYHTHSRPVHMGVNASAIMHFLHGIDPRFVGVYLDPAHLILDGEHPDIAFNIVKKYLAIIGLKDGSKMPSPVNAGYQYVFARAGHGMVDWPNFFDNLRRANFQGPLSVHAEYERYLASAEKGDKTQYFASLKGELEFFKRHRDGTQPVEMKL